MTENKARRARGRDAVDAMPELSRIEVRWMAVVLGAGARLSLVLGRRGGDAAAADP